MMSRLRLLAAIACLGAPLPALAQAIAPMPASCDNAKFLSDQQTFEQRGAPGRIFPSIFAGASSPLHPMRSGPAADGMAISTWM